jgi:hypothetical protein
METSYTPADLAAFGEIGKDAPEPVPDLPFLIEGLAPVAPRLMLRTNLSALSGAGRE